MKFILQGVDLACSSKAGRCSPLRRGLEIDRFNERARRQDALTESEADELYRYRIRRLRMRAQQVGHAPDAANEQAILGHAPFVSLHAG